MTSRRTAVWDRTGTLVLSLVLLVSGAALVWWWSGRSPAADPLSTRTATELTQASWWPAALGAAGVLLVLLGLAWLLAHLHRSTVDRLHVSGSGPQGRLDAAAGEVVGAAADAFADTIGVRRASGSLVRDRGQLVASITATVERECDLAALAQHADLVSAQLHDVLGRDDIRCRVQLKVARLGARMPRAL